MCTDIYKHLFHDLDNFWEELQSIPINEISDDLERIIHYLGFKELEILEDLAE